MGELHSRKKKEVHHIIKPKIIIKKEPQEEKKDSILHSLLKRNHKSTKNIFNYVNDKKLKEFTKIFHRVNKDFKCYDYYSKQIYINNIVK